MTTFFFRKKSRPIPLIGVVGLALLLLTGCPAVGPDYVRPDTPMPETWNRKADAGLSPAAADPVDPAQWWTVFKDEKLSDLVVRAAKGNLDLKEALARIREARAKRGKEAAGLFPTLDGSAKASWSRSGDVPAESETKTGFQAGFDASWEIDLFGGTRRSIEAAQADLEASEEDSRDVLVSLEAETATNYVQVRAYQTRLRMTEESIQSLDATRRLVQLRFQAGLTDELALRQAEYNLENARSQRPDLKVSLEEALNRIAVLLGEHPGRVHEELAEPQEPPSPPSGIALGIPADLLRRRPDIRQAERQLAAQTARIGAATADLYPKFTLAGSIGLETLSLTDASSAVWNLTGGPGLSWALFQGGAIRKNIEVQNALQEQYLMAYRSTVLNALEEVENALAAYAQEQQKQKSLAEAVMAAEKAADLAGKKYQAGQTDLTDLLEAQRSLLTYRDQRTQSETALATHLIRLFKALGGGWSPDSPVSQAKAAK